MTDMNMNMNTKYHPKYCVVCDTNIAYKNWSKHCQTKKHKNNDPNNTITTRIRKKTITTTKKLKKQRVPKDHRVFYKFSEKLFNKSKKNRSVILEKDTAFNSRVKTFTINNNFGFKDTIKFMNHVERIVLGKIQEGLNKQHGLKVNFILHCIHQRKITGTETMEYKDTHFKTKNEIILKTTDRSDYYLGVKTKLTNEMQEFQIKQSQWCLQKIVSLELCINKFIPLRGASYIELPKFIQLKHAVINVKNEDNKCFLWALLSALYPAEHNPQRVSTYKKWKSVFDKEFKDIEFPVKLTDIHKIVDRLNISINVYCIDEFKPVIIPLKITKIEKEKHIDLLYLKEKNNEHYCWIKDLWKLVGHDQISKHEHKRFLCKMCLTSHKTQDKLNEHKTYCMHNKCTKVILPEPSNNIVQFSHYNHSLKVPVSIYADFECMLEKIQNCQPCDNTSYINPYQKHTPISFVFYIKYSDGSFKKSEEYFGLDAPKVFVQKIKEKALNIAENYLDVKVPMKELTKKQWKNFKNAKTCHICERKMEDIPPQLLQSMKKKEKKTEFKNNMRKVRDHDHLTGNYRGAAHSYCNLNHQVPRFIPVLFHNLSGYDAHLFIKEFNGDNQRINLIPDNEEKYVSFSNILDYQSSACMKNKCLNKFCKKSTTNIVCKNQIEIRFLDSFKFLSCSLDELANNLEKNQFKELGKHFPREHLDLITKKLSYPYEYMDCIEKYSETCLPPKELFYSSLTKKHITDDDYKNAQEVWNAFNIQNLREFTMLYNKIDVFLLSDIIENFRHLSLETYKLDPLWCYTTPGFAWNCMLRKTGVKLELLTDYDMHLFVEKGLRGGMTQCSVRYSKANNKYMMEKFNKNKDSVYLQYLDANNLYGWAMSQSLPSGGFKWIDPEKITDILNLSVDSSKGYIFEVDLTYPQELHDKHSDFPFAPENQFDGVPLPKLTLNLYDKKKYVVHYITLQEYIRNGLRIEKIHKILEFDQSPWLKPYIDLNTNLRTKARNNFEKDFYKLMNNSVFGRTMMNVRNHVDIRLVTNASQLEKLVAKPNFDRATIFTENLAAIHMKRTSTKLFQPVYVGMTILDISKKLMYDFYYNVLKEKYGDKIRLLYCDTDSLIIEVKTNDFYQDMKNDIDHYDTSDYPLDNIYNIPLVNKKVIGKFKDELNGKIMDEFIGLRSKLYSFTEHSTGKEVKKAKGVKKCVVDKEICHNDFKKCLTTQKSLSVKQNIFRTKNHDICTIEQNKTALSAHDDKRFILENGIDTLAWGHYKTGISRENFIDHINNLIKNNNSKK